MLQKADLVQIRPVSVEDTNFILATWLRGAYYGDTWFRLIPKSIFMEHYHKVVSHLVGSNDAVIQVACLKEDPNVILGYSVCRVLPTGIVLDWLFVKSAWRNIGIGKSLVPKDLNAVTHLTKTGQSLLSKNPNVIFNPFLI